MKKLIIMYISFFFLVGSSFGDERASEDKVRFILISLGTPKVMSTQLSNQFKQLRMLNPGKEAYIDCLETHASPDIFLNKLTSVYASIFSPESQLALYNLLTSKSGNAFIKLVQAGPPFENARARLSQDEIKDFETASNSLKQYFTIEINSRIQEATSALGKEVVLAAKSACSSFESNTPVTGQKTI